MVEYQHNSLTTNNIDDFESSFLRNLIAELKGMVDGTQTTMRMLMSGIAKVARERVEDFDVWISFRGCGSSKARFERCRLRSDQ